MSYLVVKGGPERNAGGYVKFRKREEVDGLDINRIDKCDISVFPGGIYERQPVNAAHYICDRLDNKYDYLIDVERTDHPWHFSRFSYADCPNGYCLGQFPGRFVTSQKCVGKGQYDENPGLYPKSMK